MVVDVQEYKPRTHPGSEGSSMSTPPLAVSYQISSRKTQERSCGSSSLPPTVYERKVRAKTSTNSVQNPDKADIIRSGDFHIGVKTFLRRYSSLRMLYVVVGAPAAKLLRARGSWCPWCSRFSVRCSSAPRPFQSYHQV